MQESHFCSQENSSHKQSVLKTSYSPNKQIYIKTSCSFLQLSSKKQNFTELLANIELDEQSSNSFWI